MDINLNLNNAPNSLDVLKYCVLYFDKITLLRPTAINHFHMGTHSHIVFTHFFSEELNSAGLFLQNEGVLQLSDGAIQNKFLSTGSNWSSDIFHIAEEIVVRNNELFFDKKFASFKDGIMHIKENAFISSDEAKDAIGNSIIDHSIYSMFGNNTTELLNHSEVFNTLELYKALIADMLDHLGDGENVLSNSMLVNKALCSFFNPSENYKRDAINKYSAINAMEILLPNIRDASLEDLLYIRHYANDELIEMRNYIDTCVSNLQLDGLSVIDVKMINENLRKKIIPATHQFERRIETLKLSSVQQFIKNIANPLYYSPLITSFFADIHPALLLAMSLGLIGIESITNYKIKNNEIKNDSLYFTVEINKYQS